MTVMTDRPWERADKGPEPGEFTVPDELVLELAVERAVTAWLDANVDALARRIAEATIEGKLIREKRRSPTVTDGRVDQYAAQRDKSERIVWSLVVARPGMGGNAIRARVKRDGLGQSGSRRALKALLDAGQIHTHKGPNRSALHYAGPSCDGGCPA